MSGKLTYCKEAVEQLIKDFTGKDEKIVQLSYQLYYFLDAYKIRKENEENQEITKPRFERGDGAEVSKNTRDEDVKEINSSTWGKRLGESESEDESAEDGELPTVNQKFTQRAGDSPTPAPAGKVSLALCDQRPPRNISNESSREFYKTSAALPPL